LRFNFTAILLVFHIFPAKSDACIISWAEIFYSVLPEPVLCYQPMCHGCCCVTIIFKLVYLYWIHLGWPHYFSLHLGFVESNSTI